MRVSGISVTSLLANIGTRIYLEIQLATGISIMTLTHLKRIKKKDVAPKHVKQIQMYK